MVLARVGSGGHRADVQQRAATSTSSPTWWGTSPTEPTGRQGRSSVAWRRWSTSRAARSPAGRQAGALVREHGAAHDRGSRHRSRSVQRRTDGSMSAGCCSTSASSAASVRRWRGRCAPESTRPPRVGRGRHRHARPAGGGVSPADRGLARRRAGAAAGDRRAAADTPRRARRGTTSSAR